jgi:hypothetical protein
MLKQYIAFLTLSFGPFFAVHQMLSRELWFQSLPAHIRVPTFDVLALIAMSGVIVVMMQLFRGPSRRASSKKIPTYLTRPIPSSLPPRIYKPAPHAKAVLKCRSTRTTATMPSIARIMQTGWFKEVHVKNIDSHSVRALLASRALLVKIKRDKRNGLRKAKVASGQT